MTKPIHKAKIMNKTERLIALRTIDRIELRIQSARKDINKFYGEFGDFSFHLIQPFENLIVELTKSKSELRKLIFNNEG